MNDGKHTMYRGMFLIGSALLPCLAHAQNSSGTAGKDTAQRIDGYYEQRQPLQPERPVVDPVQPATPPAGQSGLADVRGSFVLREVRFSPSALLPKATLDAIAARYQGREVHLAELETLVADVNAAYEAAGISTARALLREQSINEGRVDVTLLEGTLGTLEVTGEGKVPVRFVERRVRQPVGEVVRSDRLRDELIYLNRTTDLQVRALMRPGRYRAAGGGAGPKQLGRVRR